MQIRIKSADDFHKLLNALISELAQALDHFGLVRDLDAAHEKFLQAFNQCHTFWYLTRRAHVDATLIRLCKAYDQNADSLNLRNLIDTIEANLHIFDEAGFRQRLKDNPFVESLAETARRPDSATLAADKLLVNEKSDARVKTLMLWRHNFIAHRGASKLLKGTNLGEEYPLRFTDIESLLEDGWRIANSYSILFIAQSHSRRMMGHDDYLRVLEGLQAQVDAHDAKIREELERFGLPAARGSAAAS